ncbi:MAG: hypothetical protein HRF44_08760 [Ignavibacterium sp.]
MAARAETVPSSFLIQQFPLPPGRLYALHGGEDALHLAHGVASSTLRRGMRVAVVDGGNWFNVHALIHAARLAGRHPDRFLDNLFLSRSFTCYQMEQAVVHLLPAFLKSIGSRAALILGLLDTLYDEQAPVREVRQILLRVVTALQAMKAEGISVLVASLDRTVYPEHRSRFVETLFRGMDVVYRLSYNRRAQLFLIRESPQKTGILHPPSSSPHNTESHLHPGDSHGTHRTDLYQYHRQRAGRLVQVPPRPSAR